jgi:hypothetical protein
MKNIIAVGIVFILCMGNAIAGEKIDRSLKTTSNGKVSIDVQSGQVNIKVWDKKEVKVVGELDDDAEGYQFETNDNGRVVFKVHMPKQKWGSWKDDGSKLTFWIPVKNNLKFEGVNVDVKAKGLRGDARINTVNGDIDASDINGRIGLGTVNGKIKSSGLKGDINLSTVNGEILDTDSEGELEIETVNGDIETDSKVNELTINNVNGDIDLNLKAIKEIEISTVNGDIDLRADLTDMKKLQITTVGGDTDVKFVGEVSAEFNIEAHSGGDIDNDLTSDKVRKDKYGPGESLKFTVGGGKAEVEISTVNGDIRIGR